MDRVYGARPSDIAATMLVGALPVSEDLSGPIVDLRKYCTYVDNQNGGQCVGEATVGANHVANKGQGRRGSHVGVYVGARARERVRKGDALPDTGCMPVDAYDHVVAVGIEPLDGRDTDPSRLNSTDTWDEALSAKKVPSNLLLPLQDGDIYGLNGALVAECPATYTQSVDQSYENLSSSNPVWSGLQGTALGRHRQVVVGRILVSGVACYIAWNSWSANWAESGFSFIPCGVFWEIASEVVVHKGGVLL